MTDIDRLTIELNAAIDAYLDNPHWPARAPRLFNEVRDLVALLRAVKRVDSGAAVEPVNLDDDTFDAIHHRDLTRSCGYRRG